MMGFVALGVIALLAFAALVLLKLPRGLWMLAGAAMFLGAAGYAWQGRPALAAVPAKPVSDPGAVEPEMVVLREMLLGRLSADASYIVASEAMTRVGEPKAAAQAILGGLHKMPRSFVLWTALGTTLAANDDDQMSPSALFAFQQATRLAPDNPAPPFYAGLAYIRSGDFARGRRLWLRAISLSPNDAPYRREIAVRLAVLDQFAAMTAGAPPPP
jgi:tetratricopeptide (TPR) repeat protein